MKITDECDCQLAFANQSRWVFLATRSLLWCVCTICVCSCVCVFACVWYMVWCVCLHSWWPVFLIDVYNVAILVLSSKYLSHLAINSIIKAVKYWVKVYYYPDDRRFLLIESGRTCLHIYALCIVFMHVHPHECGHMCGFVHYCAYAAMLIRAHSLFCPSGQCLYSLLVDHNHQQAAVKAQ